MSNRNQCIKQTFLFFGIFFSLNLSSAASHIDQQKEFIDHLSKKSVTDLDQVPATLSSSFRANFIVKHGMDVDGPRGHKHEPDVPGFGIHASPLDPRVYVFNPNTGMALSYNGNKSQQGGQTLDLMTYDEKLASFDFQKIEFPIKDGKIGIDNQNCVVCHGGAGNSGAGNSGAGNSGAGSSESLRPIFSMYPDWPRFYGSDNDELKLALKYPTESSIPKGTDPVTRKRIENQKKEWENFHKFTTEIAPTHPRYSPLFADDAFVIHKFGVARASYPEYPYRSDVEAIGEKLDPSDVSRAFTRRAGLRFNLLYSRLLVKQVVRKITSQKEQFQNFGSFFVYNTMRCAPLRSSNAVIQKWSKSLLASLNRIAEDNRIEYKYWDASGAATGHPLAAAGKFSVGSSLDLLGEKKSLLQYGQNLALFGLKINDVDMRFTYYHPDYLPTNSYRQLKPLDVMQVGYLDGTYFNSYNDGSTTMDEHLTAELLKELSRSNKTLSSFLGKRGNLAIRGLLDKYGSDTFKERMKLDRPFFEKMDSYSKWFSLPYPYKAGDEGKPTSFMELHHRAPFTQAYRESYNEVCRILETELLSRH